MTDFSHVIEWNIIFSNTHDSAAETIETNVMSFLF